MKKVMFKVFITAMISASFASCSMAQKSATSGQTKPAPPSVTELLTKMDSDNDGKLSKAEVKGPLANDFSKIDTNSDQFLSKEELEKAPKPNGQKPPRGQKGQQGAAPRSN